MLPRVRPRAPPDKELRGQCPDPNISPPRSAVGCAAPESGAASGDEIVVLVENTAPGLTSDGSAGAVGIAVSHADTARTAAMPSKMGRMFFM